MQEGYIIERGFFMKLKNELIQSRFQLLTTSVLSVRKGRKRKMKQLNGLFFHLHLKSSK